MSEELSDLPQAESADPDGVQVALRAAQTLWSRGDTTESLKWLRKAAESASDEGADVRSFQLAKAAAELRAKLFGSSEPPPRSTAVPTPVPAGESGAHPIAQLREPSRNDRQHDDLEPARGAPLSPLPSSQPGADGFASSSAADDSAMLGSSRPVTATQYPSHRPRQRMGLLSSAPGTASRESAGYAAVPSWSADSERRISAAPPPLPFAAADDYDELEAEPDDEAADDPGSVWSGAGPDSWPPAAPSAASGVTPPPLPPRGAFADDDGDFTRQSDPQTVVIPVDDNEEARAERESRRAAASFAVQGNAWDQQSRTPTWEHDVGSSSWAAELHQSTWGNGGGSLEAPAAEPAPQSETGRARLTARVHHQAVRVSFAPDLRVPGQYVVRPLREGEKAASGERIALLVALEPGVPLV